MTDKHITVILPVSRTEFLDEVLDCLEYQGFPDRTDLLVIVDGPKEMFVKVRNRIIKTNFAEKLVIQSGLEPFNPTKTIADAVLRRTRIAAIHNLARKTIQNTDYVFLIEDDTTIESGAFTILLDTHTDNLDAGIVQGIEYGRWGNHYAGSWLADDIKEPKLFTSEAYRGDELTRVDGCGLYCLIVDANLYKQHEFTASNGLGPDVNFAMWVRNQGLQNYTNWYVKCKHHFLDDSGRRRFVYPDETNEIVTLTKVNDEMWRASLLT